MKDRHRTHPPRRDHRRGQRLDRNFDSRGRRRSVHDRLNFPVKLDHLEHNQYDDEEEREDTKKDRKKNIGIIGGMMKGGLKDFLKKVEVDNNTRGVRVRNRPKSIASNDLSPSLKRVSSPSLGRDFSNNRKVEEVVEVEEEEEVKLFEISTVNCPSEPSSSPKNLEAPLESRVESPDFVGSLKRERRGSICENWESSPKKKKSKRSASSESETRSDSQEKYIKKKKKKKKMKKRRERSRSHHSDSEVEQSCDPKKKKKKREKKRRRRSPSSDSEGERKALDEDEDEDLLLEKARKKQNPKVELSVSRSDVELPDDCEVILMEKQKLREASSRAETEEREKKDSIEPGRVSVKMRLGPAIQDSDPVTESQRRSEEKTSGRDSGRGRRSEHHNLKSGRDGEERKSEMSRVKSRRSGSQSERRRESSPRRDSRRRESYRSEESRKDWRGGRHSETRDSVKVSKIRDSGSRDRDRDKLLNKIRSRRSSKSEKKLEGSPERGGRTLYILFDINIFCQQEASARSFLLSRRRCGESGGVSSAASLTTP